MAKYEKQTHDDVSARDDFHGAGLAECFLTQGMLGRPSRLLSGGCQAAECA